MRNILFAAYTLTILATAFPAGAAANRASEPTGPMDQSLYTCAAGGLSRVAFLSDQPPCCTGSFGCPQLLSNTGLIKPKRVNRT